MWDSIGIFSPINKNFLHQFTLNIQHFYDFIKRIPHPCKRATLFFRSIWFSQLLFTTMTMASFEDVSPGPHAQAMAGAGVANHEAHPLLNPAALIAPHKLYFNIAHSRPFGLQELQQSHLLCAYTFTSLGAALVIQSYGFTAYRENTFCLSLAAVIVHTIRAGISLRYADLEIIRYGRADAVIVDFGMQADLSTAFTLGFCTKNINGARIGRCHEDLPRILQIGAAIKAHEKLNLCADIYKDVHFPVDLRCGLEWRPIKQVFLRCGLATATSRIAAGFALNLNSIRVEYGLMTHEYLGLSHQFSLGISLHRK